MVAQELVVLQYCQHNLQPTLRCSFLSDAADQSAAENAHAVKALLGLTSPVNHTAQLAAQSCLPCLMYCCCMSAELWRRVIHALMSADVSGMFLVIPEGAL
jgi:hypothetical protein